MPDAGFGGADRQRGRSRPGPAIDSCSLCAVIKRCAGAVGVDIVNLRWIYLGAFASQRHGSNRPISLGLRLGEVVWIHRGAVTNELPNYDRTSPARAVQRLEGKDRRAFAEGQAIAPGVERAADRG